MQPDGSTIDTVDLTKLGRFANPREAHANLLYRDLAVMQNGALVPLQEAQWESGKPVETLYMSDRLGRQYEISLTQRDAGAVKVDAIASLNADRVTKKEPTYPGAKTLRSTEASSPNGRFEVRMKLYKMPQGQQGQMTLIAHLQDPLKGAKTVELWSHPFHDWPLGVKVSDSGRVFAVTIQAMGERKMALFASWDPDGRSIGGWDLTSRGWYASADEVEKLFDMSKVKVDMVGAPGQIEVEGVPIPTAPTERLTIPTSNGESKELWISLNPLTNMPSMMYISRPGHVKG
jgi:hypothetical protein